MLDLESNANLRLDSNFEEWNWATFTQALRAVANAPTYASYTLHASLLEHFMQWYKGQTKGLWETFYVYSRDKQGFLSIAEMAQKINDAHIYYKGKSKHNSLESTKQKF